MKISLWTLIISAIIVLGGALFLSSESSAESQESYSITGHVLDTSDSTESIKYNAIPEGLKVVAYDQNGAQVGISNLDVHHDFCFSDISNGKYTIAYLNNGFRTVMCTVVVDNEDVICKIATQGNAESDLIVPNGALISEDDFVVDGNKYRINNDLNSVSLIGISGVVCSESIIIPSAVLYDGLKYPVKNIGSNAKDVTQSDHYLKDASAIISNYVFGTSYPEYGSKLTITIQGEDVYVMPYAFMLSNTDPNTAAITKWSGISLIDSITFEGSVKYLGKFAFFGSGNVVINKYSDNFDTATKAGLGVFEDCVFANSSVVNVEIPEGFTKLTAFAFYNCTELESVIFPSTLVDIKSPINSATWIAGNDNVGPNKCTFYKCPVKNVYFKNSKTVLTGYLFSKGAMPEVTFWNIEESNLTVPARSYDTSGIVFKNEVPLIVDYELDGGQNNAENKIFVSTKGGNVELFEATKTNYTFAGWFTDTEFKNQIESIGEGIEGNVTLYAKFVPTEYTFIFMNGDDKVSDVKFTIENMVDQKLPEVPAKANYSGAWDLTGFSLEDKTVNAIYTPIEYTFTFMNGAEKVAEVKFTVEDMAEQKLPEVPAKVGYTDGIWDLTEFSLEDKTVNAVYTYVVPATAEKDVKVELTVDTFRMPAEQKETVTVAMNNNVSVKVTDASGLADKNVTAKVEKAVVNNTGIEGTVYEFTFEVEGKGYTGNMQVTVPYTPVDGKEPVVYFYDNGAKEAMKIIASDDTSVTFETSHNSTYVITSEVPEKSEDNTLMVVAIIAIIVVVFIAAMIFSIKRIEKQKH